LPARILVVEASDEGRTLIADVLTADGHAVKRVTSGVVSILGGAFEGSGLRGESCSARTSYCETCRDERFTG
jgi:CheY-like chemotaxis protein